MHNNVDLVQLTQETKKLSAMVVEDNKEVNDALSETFKNFFADVKSCYSGEEALEIYKETFPDVVFVDMILSEMDGIELSRRIRELNQDQIIIVISASHDLEKISQTIQVGVNSFVQKPIDSKKIIDMLTSIIALVSKRNRAEVRIFSISLPLDTYSVVSKAAKAESISKNAIVIRALRNLYKEI